MSSYADIAAKGPKQTNAEKMPPQVPEIAHEDSSVHSLDSLDSTHISSIPSYADQQLASERADEAEREATQAADKMASNAKVFTQQAEADLSRLEHDGEQKAADAKKEAGKKADEAGKKFDEKKEQASKKYSEVKAEAGKKYEEAKEVASKKYGELKKEAGVEGQKAKENAREAEDWADKNKGNPVVIGNAVAITALAGLLGIGAYRMHTQGTLTWKVAGTWAGVVGLFALGDYYVSQYFFKQHPTKK